LGIEMCASAPRLNAFAYPLLRGAQDKTPNRRHADVCLPERCKGVLGSGMRKGSGFEQQPPAAHAASVT